MVAVEGFSCVCPSVEYCVFSPSSTENVVKLFVVFWWEGGPVFECGWWTVCDLMLCWEVLPGLWKAEAIFVTEIKGECSVGVCVLGVELVFSINEWAE